MSKKQTTDDDMQFFLDAMSGIEKTKSKSSIPHQQKQLKPVPLNLSVNDDESDDYGDLNIDTPEFLAFRRPGIQHRVYQDLQRGYIEPENSLDLHGMRVIEARECFSRFMRQALSRGQRCIRIIHGKGRGSEGQQPVLKQKTNQWLQQNDAVLAFCAAPRWDGGSGAAYVLLSRKHRLDP